MRLLCNGVKYYNMSNTTINNTPTRALFVFNNGVCLSRSLFIKQVKLYIALVGLDPRDHSGNSFRIGGATTAAAVGLSDWEIQILGRWSSIKYIPALHTNTCINAGRVCT